MVPLQKDISLSAYFMPVCELLKKVHPFSPGLHQSQRCSSQVLQSYYDFVAGPAVLRLARNMTTEPVTEKVFDMVKQCSMRV